MQAPATQSGVRPARPSDLNALGAIWLELMRFHEQADPAFTLAEDGLERWLDLSRELLLRDDAFILVADEHGRSSGYCLGWIGHNPAIYQREYVGFISEIAVSQAVRRRGIGRRLLYAARQWFNERGLSEFQLSTAVWNEGAQAFWRAMGGDPLLVRYRFEVHPESEVVR